MSVAAARAGGSACATLPCCTCGGAKLHMRWPGCMCAVRRPVGPFRSPLQFCPTARAPGAPCTCGAFCPGGGHRKHRSKTSDAIANPSFPEASV
eukprot:7632369-Alexandrium_andersonii.AAC.1